MIISKSVGTTSEAIKVVSISLWGHMLAAFNCAPDSRIRLEDAPSNKGDHPASRIVSSSNYAIAEVSYSVVDDIIKAIGALSQ
jgi:hypothetical protein